MMGFYQLLDEIFGGIIVGATIALMIYLVFVVVEPNASVSIPVIENLNSKYGGEFEIESIEKEDLDTEHTKYRFKVIVKSLDDDIKFTAYLSSDKKEFFDFYEKSRHENEIQKEIDSYDGHSHDFKIIDTDIAYGATYDEASSDYKDKENVSVSVKAEITGDNTKEIAEAIRGYIKRVYSAGYEVSVKLINGNTNRTVTQYKDEELITVEEIEEKVKFLMQ